MFDPTGGRRTDDDRERQLEREYELAMDEWFGSEDAQLWDTVVADGLDSDESGTGLITRPDGSAR